MTRQEVPSAPDRARRLLAALGVTGTQEVVYRALLRHGPTDRGELARLVDRPTPALDKVVRRLEQEGLVHRITGEPPRLAATAPHVAVEALAARREKEIAAARRSVEVLEDEAHRPSGPPPEDLLEVISGQDAVSRAFQQMNLGARHDVRALVRPPFVVDVATPASQDSALDRGISARSVFDASAFETPGLLAGTKQLIAKGEQVRIGVVPIKLVIVDSSIALLPLTSGGRNAQVAAVLVHQSTLLDALISLFETLWQAASPLRWDPVGAPVADSRVDPQDREILSLLIAGLKDETAARQLGLGLRTLQRRLSATFEDLGARTRFQAGYVVAQQGILSPDIPDGAADDRHR